MFRLDRIGEMTLGDRFPPDRDKTLVAYYRRTEAEECEVGAPPRT